MNVSSTVGVAECADEMSSLNAKFKQGFSDEPRVYALFKIICKKDEQSLSIKQMYSSIATASFILHLALVRRF